ncbi:GAF and ANTAR domain-containing protein [Actinomadura sp. DC4]|uniref:GAF and ANTAR domain-containing protein n=1 Tax=Actinomadura sp. DC4 TaxID=3055069 RepID=UPI0025B02D92|nr:GAF and ANTAR domain-containing protein [Actinomadura sp. DC4]MDN3357831.1 GAF and ANTAR domain-containing protein [Actinomadura sp. DC4]
MEALDLLTGISRLICNAIEGVDGCGITLLYEGVPLTTAFPAELAALDDEFQRTAGDGPCVEALWSQSVVECRDLSEELRWGAYPAAALGCGMRSVLSVPVDARAAGHGALNLYSRTAAGFDDDDRREALEFADVTATVLAERRKDDASGMARGWRESLARRTAVAQAVGVLMARRACGRDEAFELLVGASRERGEEIHLTAARIGAGSAGS